MYGGVIDLLFAGKQIYGKKRYGDHCRCPRRKNSPACFLQAGEF